MTAILAFPYDTIFKVLQFPCHYTSAHYSKDTNDRIYAIENACEYEGPIGKDEYNNNCYRPLCHCIAAVYLSFGVMEKEKCSIIE